MLLTYLCTYNNYLPQGSPTSSYISNLVMKQSDKDIGHYCDKNNISYTRYSDDLTFLENLDKSKKLKISSQYRKENVIESHLKFTN